jgi:hypothetical protein
VILSDIRWSAVNTTRLNLKCLSIPLMAIDHIPVCAPFDAIFSEFSLSFHIIRINPKLYFWRALRRGTELRPARNGFHIGMSVNYGQRIKSDRQKMGRWWRMTVVAGFHGMVTRKHLPSEIIWYPNQFSPNHWARVSRSTKIQDGGRRKVSDKFSVDSLQFERAMKLKRICSVEICVYLGKWLIGTEFLWGSKDSN